MTFREQVSFHKEGNIAIVEVEDPKHEHLMPMAIVGGSGRLAVEQTIKEEITKQQSELPVSLKF